MSERGGVDAGGRAVAPGAARTLVLSHRRVHPVVSRCLTFELEDVIREIDAADLGSVRGGGWSRSKALVQRIAPWADSGAHGVQIPRAERYELLFVSLHSTSELWRLQPLRRVLSRAVRTACNVDEVWLSDLAQRPRELAMLSRFDLIFTPCQGAVAALSEAVGKECHYLPPSVDTLRFFPYPEPGPRVIDVYFMGRRRESLHRVIRDALSASSRVYLYDTGITGPLYDDHVEHRVQLARRIQRTKYFVVDVSKADRPEQSGSQPEIASRYFEGAAAGAVLIGVAPSTAAFSRLFGWDNAVIQAPDSPAELAALLDDLDGREDAVEAIRRANVLNSLRAHDCLHRWEQVLRAAGMEPLLGLYERRQRLEERAKTVENWGRL